MKETVERVAFWRGHWEAWAKSGLNQRAYCARQGLSYAAFGYWRNRVQESPAVAISGFVPVVVEPAEGVAVPGSAVAGTGIEIRLAQGRRVVVGPDFDAAVLARVIRVLEGLPC